MVEVSWYVCCLHVYMHIYISAGVVHGVPMCK